MPRSRRLNPKLLKSGSLGACFLTTNTVLGKPENKVEPKTSEIELFSRTKLNPKLLKSGSLGACFLTTNTVLGKPENKVEPKTSEI